MTTTLLAAGGRAAAEENPRGVLDFAEAVFEGVRGESGDLGAGAQPAGLCASPVAEPPVHRHALVLEGEDIERESRKLFVAARAADELENARLDAHGASVARGRRAASA